MPQQKEQVAQVLKAQELMHEAKMRHQKVLRWLPPPAIKNDSHKTEWR